MTLTEKLGQMTQADYSALRETPEDVTTYAIGSVLNGGESDPPVNDAAGWADITDQFHILALKTRLAIPLLYAVDAVHGHNNVSGAVLFPHNVGLGASGDAALVERIANATASELRATGIDWTFAPTVAVSRDDRWGRAYESYAEEATLVGQLGAAAVWGLQGPGLGRTETSVLACAKHFVADGGTLAGVNEGDAVLSEQELEGIHLAPYIDAVRAGVGSVMVSFSSVNGEKMHANAHLIQHVLKGELGFKGFVVSDWGALNKLPGTYAEQVQAGVNAGLDMVMVPTDYKTFIGTLKTLVESNAVPPSRIDDAVMRILGVKCELGLFERAATVDRGSLATVGSAEHRALGREAVQKSIVVLRNEGALPISPTASVHVAGAAATTLLQQVGGWSLCWQGLGPDCAQTTTGTTLYDALAAAGEEVTYSADGSGAQGADVGIVVVGEPPYAESRGDARPGDDAPLDDLELSSSDVALIQSVSAAASQTVVVIYSGRPMILSPILSDADAIVAAFLPGTEVSGLADVLFGSAPSTGRLSFSWPRDMTQVPINVGDASYDPLFAFGFGL